MKYIITLIFVLIQSIQAHASDKPIASSQCAESFSKNKMLGGWYLWEPYQFNKVTSSGYNLTGMDIDLVKSIAKRVGVEITYEQVDWKEHQEDLRSGERDIAAGATYTANRAEYVYFSVPYRFEENSLFTLSDSNKSLEFQSISEFLAQIRLQNYILGVTEGFI
ncbi:substrate-binding periplasmic protein, partial [Candidatus Megaera venefica]|uniref:substrate-binding periplasmic protein n=1 Tax=Candidatus Megaera venefica TaxID=2055910 RepID=UPI002AD295E9